MPHAPHTIQEYHGIEFNFGAVAGDLLEVHAVTMAFTVLGWGLKQITAFAPGTTDAVLRLRSVTKAGVETDRDTITVSGANVVAANRARGQVIQDDLLGEGNEFDILPGESVKIRLNTAQVGGAGSAIPAFRFSFADVPDNKNTEKVEVNT